MKYSTYIFDFDYTLGDATKGIVESINFALKRMNLSVYEKDDIRKTIGMALPDAFSYLTGINDQNLKSQFVKLFTERADQVMIENTELFVDTIEILAYLKSKRKTIGIVTNKNHYRIDEILEKFNIAHLIDAVIGGDDVKKGKPDPEPLFMAIEKLNAKREDVVFIGDSAIIDAKATQNAGIDFIAITTGTTSKSEFSLFPNITILNSLSELKDMV